jgi:hypothetical protein
MQTSHLENILIDARTINIYMYKLTVILNESIWRRDGSEKLIRIYIIVKKMTPADSYLF